MFLKAYMKKVGRKCCKLKNSFVLNGVNKRFKRENKKCT